MPFRSESPAAGARSVREVARCRALFPALLLGAFAPGQDDSVHRLFAADAARLITHEDPVVRGEAALVLASSHASENHTAILAVAKDEHPDAQVRGLLALGLQGTPGVAIRLEELLEDQSSRTEPAGIAAAWALGSLAPDHAPVATTRVLSSFLHGSWKRQRDVLLALLCGMARHPQDGQAVALRRLFDEESNRDPEVRARLLALLLPIPDAFDGKQLRKVLDRGSEEERQALVAWLAANSSPFDAELLQPIERLATQSLHPHLRAQALAVLTRMRHLPALELAAKALRSAHAVEVAQGMRSALAIGGAGMRLALEAHLRAEQDPALQAAMLRAYAAPPSGALTEMCARLAADASAAIDLRIAAATTLSRADAERAAPLLRTLFRETERPACLLELATALQRGDATPPALARLMPGPVDLHQQSARWCALLATSHPEAVLQLLGVLGSRAATAADLTQALRAWRTTMVVSAPAEQALILPESLRAVLGR